MSDIGYPHLTTDKNDFKSYSVLYLHLTCHTTDDVDFMIEFLCTD